MAAPTVDAQPQGEATVSSSPPVDPQAVRELREHILANRRRGLVIDLTEAGPVEDAAARALRRRLRRMVARKDGATPEEVDLRAVLEAD